VELDRITIRLRPRSGWEAIDLGFRLALENWRPVWGVWFALYLPVATVLASALAPFWAMMVLWWLKPLFGRFVLYVLSRRVFGETGSVLGALGAWRETLTPGLIPDLLWRRFFPTRTFSLPVAQLERQRGAPARARRKLLGRRNAGYAVWLWFACLNLESACFLGFAFLIDEMLWPGEVEPEVESDTGPFGWFADLDEMFVLVDLFLYVAAVSLIEPLFVAGGFALYLNRRTLLEGWDVELALRRLAERLASVRALAAACALAAAQTALPTPSLAQAELDPALADATPTETAEVALDRAPLATPARAAIEAVLRDPTFGQKVEVERWRWRGASTDDDERRKLDLPWLERLLRLVADLWQLVVWVALGIVVLLLLRAAIRRYESRTIAPASSTAPAELFGLAIAPTSLPDDIGTAASALVGEGRLREALALVYRAALSRLVHERKMRVAPGATEGEVLAGAASVLDSDARDWFARLVALWIAAAWAGRLPGSDEVIASAEGFGRYFARAVASTP
jgi:hypothetical protein